MIRAPFGTAQLAPRHAPAENPVPALLASVGPPLVGYSSQGATSARLRRAGNRTSPGGFLSGILRGLAGARFSRGPPLEGLARGCPLPFLVRG